MNNEPSTSVKVLITEAFSLLGQLKLEEARRKDVESGRSSILNNECWLLSFSDDSAKSCEWFGNCFCVTKSLRYGVLIVNYICFFLVENMNDKGTGCLKTEFINLWVIMDF